MIQQQKQRIRRIEQRLASARGVLDPVVNRVFAVGHKDFVSILHSISFAGSSFSLILFHGFRLILSACFMILPAQTKREFRVKRLTEDSKTLATLARSKEGLPSEV